MGNVKTIVIIGGGFAGLVAAIVAARKLGELAVPTGEIRIAMVNRDPFHSIRVRNYERDLSQILGYRWTMCWALRVWSASRAKLTGWIRAAGN